MLTARDLTNADEATLVAAASAKRSAC